MLVKNLEAQEQKTYRAVSMNTHESISPYINP